MNIAIHQNSDARTAVLLANYARSVDQRHSRTLIGVAAFLVCLALASWSAEVDLRTLGARIGGIGSYLYRILHLDSGQWVWSDPVEWFWGLHKWTILLGETLLIAYLGTALGALGAFCLCFLSAANLNANAWSRFAAKRFLEFSRTVPELVFALIFVIAFGLGGVPGVLALALHTMGALGKMFAEVVENIDMKPVEGLAASGATWTQQIRYAVVPQVLSNFASYGLLRFEINVRGASVMGFVGAGGIGQELILAVRKFYYSDVSALLLLIILTVFVIDMLTGKLRDRLLDREKH